MNNAREYFREHLCGGDYYSEEKAVSGEWFGKSAESLGLSGSIEEKDFLALCEGKNPQTGEKLNQRIKKDKRRIFTDFVISCPKSISIVGKLSDPKVDWLHYKCVKKALQELETFAGARVRKGGAMENRNTENILAGIFQHDTSRALDPMIHSHCVIFNTTYDPVENKWKALEKGEMLKSIRYIHKVYEHELCRGLQSLGYEVEFRNKQLEIKKISRETIEKFSKRHQEIQKATERHIKEKGLTATCVGALNEQVRLDTRQKKNKSAPKEELKKLWKEQLTEKELDTLKWFQMFKSMYALQWKHENKPENAFASINTSIEFAKEHWFERHARGKDYELLTVAMEHNIGKNFGIEALKEEFQKAGFLNNAKNKRELTTEQALMYETYIVETAKNGVGQYQERSPWTRN